jgi:hypothetical protein
MVVSHFGQTQLPPLPMPQQSFSFISWSFFGELGLNLL